MAQDFGMPLAAIVYAPTVPDDREPEESDWQAVSRHWQPLIQERIDVLVRLREGGGGPGPKLSSRKHNRARQSARPHGAGKT